MSEQLISYEVNQVYPLNVDDLAPNPEQVRKHFDKNSIEALAASIEEDGLLQNVTFTEKEGMLYVVSGGRRFEALNLLKKQGKEVPPLFGKYVTGSLRKLALVENLFREDMTAVEFAEAVQALQEDDEALTQGAIAKIIGLKRTTVNGILSIAKMIAKMPEETRNELRMNPHVSRDRLEKISRLRSPKQQEKAVAALLKEIEKSLTDAEEGSPLKDRSRGQMVANSLAEFTKRLGRFGKTEYAICISPVDRALIATRLTELQSEITITLDNMTKEKAAWDKQYTENQEKKQNRKAVSKAKKGKSGKKNGK